MAGLERSADTSPGRRAALTDTRRSDRPEHPNFDDRKRPQVAIQSVGIRKSCSQLPAGRHYLARLNSGSWQKLQRQTAFAGYSKLRKAVPRRLVWAQYPNIIVEKKRIDVIR